MKNEKTTVKRIITILLVYFIFYSCGDNSGLIPLNRITIPEYQESDYIKLLDNSNREIVYSSVCNLIDKGDNYAQTLSNDTLKDTVAINNAKLVYSKISNLLYSNDEWIVCSALRFFSSFGGAYKNKEELADKLLKVKLKTKSIKLEFINAIQGLDLANNKSLNSVITDYINNDSWMVSRYSYNVVPYFKSNELSNRLISKYKSAEEYDKLLIIQCLNERFNDTILDFLLTQVQSERNQKVKLFIIKNLSKARNTQMAIDWVIKSYPELDSLKNPITQHYISTMEDSISVEILYSLIKNSLISDSAIAGSKSEFFKNLYSRIYEDGRERANIRPQNIKKLDNLILDHKKYGLVWLAVKIEHNKPIYKKEFEQQQLSLIREYEVKVSKLYDAYKIEKKYKDEYINRIDGLKNEFRKENKK